jgi:hypothetical protein
MWLGLFLVLGAPRALAVTEFCPAALTIAPVGTTAANQPATTYGFILKASGPRNLIATLTFDTDKGWFSSTTPALALAEKQYHYELGAWTAARSTWNSPLMYVSFPSPVRLTNAWVSIANAQACAPSVVHQVPVNDPFSESVTFFRNKVVAKEADQLSVAPVLDSVVLPARTIAPVYSPACAKPFSEAEFTRAARPDPGNTTHFATHTGISIVEAAINPDGSLAQAWIWLPSGEPAWDNALLWSAQHSQYKNAVAYCQPVPSYYLIGLSFW